MEKESNKKYRLRLTKDESDIIQAWRERGHLPELLEQCKSAGIPLSDVKHYWHKSEKFSIFAKNDTPSLESLFEPILLDLQSYSPKFKKIARSPVSDPHCLIIDPADVHVGKYSSAAETGSHYDIEKAVKQVDDGIDGVLSKAFGFNVDKVIFVIGNDVLHTDSTIRTTTRGTPQDTSGMWHEAFVAAKEMYIRAIEKMLPYSDVEIVFNPSNHDYMSGFMLAQTIEAYFRNSENVKFDVSIRHRKYLKYGNSMIGTSHGDGAKPEIMPQLMAYESPQMWADSVYRYMYLHHVHHKMLSKDLIGVAIEHVRTPTPPDSYHHKFGYVGAKKAIEGFIHSLEDGQVARITQKI